MPQRVRVLFLILYFILFICGSFVSAYKLGISPPYLNFELNESVRGCANVTIYADFEGNAVIDDKWTKEEFSKNTNYYTLSADEVLVNSVHPFSKSLEKENIIELCLNSSKAGRHYGVLLVGVPEKKIGVGSWINFTVIGNEKIGIVQKITGNSILNEKNKDGGNLEGRFLANLLIVQGAFLVLLLIFGVLLSKLFSK